MDIERRRYVLTEHRELPTERQPVWVFALPRAMDMQAARKAAAASLTSEDVARLLQVGGLLKLRPEAILAHVGQEHVDLSAMQNGTLARCLRRLEGGPVFRAGERLQVPEDPDIEARLRWVERLPYRWVEELGTVLVRGGDLDEEDE